MKIVAFILYTFEIDEDFLLNGESFSHIILWKTGMVEIHGCMSPHAIDLDLVDYQVCVCISVKL